MCPNSRFTETVNCIIDYFLFSSDVYLQQVAALWLPKPLFDSALVLLVYLLNFYLATNKVVIPRKVYIISVKRLYDILLTRMHMS
jgi:hypothetical protein